MDKKEKSPSIFDIKKKWAEGVEWISKKFDLTLVEAGICATGGVVVVLGALLLLALNMDAMLLAFFLALSFGFAVLSLTSGIALLQEETIEVTYSFSVPFDLTTHNLPEIIPAMILPDTVSAPTEGEKQSDPIRSQYEEIARLAYAIPPPTTLKQKKAKKRGFPIRLKKEVILTYGGEIIQYQVFKLFQVLQRSLWLSHHGRKRNEPPVNPPPHETPEEAQAEMDAKAQEEERRQIVGQPPRLSKMYQFQGEPLWNIVSVNPFSVVDSERDYWKTAHLYLPENTRASLNYVVASPYPDHLGYNMQLVKPWFFDIRFTIIPITPTDWNIPPITREIPDEEAIINVKYNIRVKAHFQRITAGNRQTEGLKEWARWLLERMKILLKARDLGLLWEMLNERAEQNASLADAEIATGKMLNVLKGHTNDLTAVAFSPDSRQIVSGSRDKTVRTWDLEIGSESAVTREPINDILAVAFMPNTPHVVSGGLDNILCLWNVETEKIIRRFKGHEHTITSVAISADGHKMASGSQDNTIRLWNPETGKRRAVLKGHENSVTSVAFSPDGCQIASGSQDKTVRLWDTETGEKRAVLKGHENSVTSVAFSPDGRQIASGSRDNTVRLWDIESGKERAIFIGHRNSVTSVTFSPDGRQIASGSRDNTVRLWDAETGKSLLLFKGHERAVTSIAFSPDGRQIASGSQDSTVRIWDTEYTQPTEAAAGETGTPTSDAVSAQPPPGHPVEETVSSLSS